MAAATLAPLACASVLGIEPLGYGPAVAALDAGTGGDGDAQGPDAPPPDPCANVDAAAGLDTPDVLVIPDKLACDDAGGFVDPLSDPANCGRCGHVCPGSLSNRCSSGRCAPEPIAKDPFSAAVFAVAGERVYWVFASGAAGSAVQSAPVSGGPPLALVAPDSGLAVRGASLLGDTVYVGGTGLSAVLIDGGARRTLSQLQGEVITHVAASRTTLFVLNASSRRAGYVDLAGAGAATLFAAVAGGVYDLTSDETQAYWLQSSDLAVADDTTRSPRTFPQPVAPDTVAIDARYVYLFDPTTRTLVRRARANLTAPPVVLARLPGQAETVLRMTVDDQNVYAVAGAGGSSTRLSLLAIPKCGGAPVLLVDGEDITDGLAAAGGYVYFGTLSGDVARVAR